MRCQRARGGRARGWRGVAPRPQRAPRPAFPAPTSFSTRANRCVLFPRRWRYPTLSALPFPPCPVCVSWCPSAPPDSALARRAASVAPAVAIQRRPRQRSVDPVSSVGWPVSSACARPGRSPNRGDASRVPWRWCRRRPSCTPATRSRRPSRAAVHGDVSPPAVAVCHPRHDAPPRTAAARTLPSANAPVTPHPARTASGPRPRRPHLPAFAPQHPVPPPAAPCFPAPRTVAQAVASPSPAVLPATRCCGGQVNARGSRRR